MKTVISFLFRLCHQLKAVFISLFYLCSHQEPVNIILQNWAPTESSFISHLCPQLTPVFSSLFYLRRYFKSLRNPEIDTKESIPPAYEAWRAGTTTLLLIGS